MPTSPAAIREAVRQVYAGPEGRLWELLMGEQIHIDGLASSMALAAKAKLPATFAAVDLCCCTGAGLRYLAKFHGLAHGLGIDMTTEVLQLGVERNRRDGVAERIRLVRADAIATGQPAGCADLVWGEDAWCYVPEKSALVAEAARLLKPGGTLAFTDWMWGSSAAPAAEATRLLRFMKFPDLLDLDGWRTACSDVGLVVETAESTGRFAAAVERYIADLTGQRAWDVLRLVGFDQAKVAAIADEMRHAHELARHRAVIQGLVVARKP